LTKDLVVAFSIMNLPKRMSFLLALGFGAASCGGPASTRQRDGGPSDILGPEPFGLLHRIVSKDGSKYLRISLKNDRDKPYRVKVSQVFFNLYETQDDLPMQFELAPGATFEHDFSFLPDAWSAKDPGPTVPVMIEYSGQAEEGFFNSSNVNNPTVSISWSSGGPDEGVFFSNERTWMLPRPLEIRILSIKVAGKELLKEPLEPTVSPGGRQRIPGVTWKDKFTIRFARRLIPNKRWAFQSSSHDPDFYLRGG
jgi:hypothetical protein